MKENRVPVFRRLSLTQQIFSMILLMLIFLSAFFAFFLNTNIDNTINRTMFSMLASAQKPVVAMLESKNGDSGEVVHYLSYDTTQTSFFYKDGSFDIPVPGHEFPAGLRTFLMQQSAGLEQDAQKTELEGIWQQEGNPYYWYMQKVDAGRQTIVLGSTMNDVYARQLRTSIVDSTVYLIIIVFFLLLMGLILWVFSIIHPLNQIRQYIQQIKQGGDVELHINRDDEIGELARELQLMKEELNKQDKAKEEMVHNISHDLKTPIATIKSYSESIKDGIYPYGDLDSSVDVILDNATRLEQKVHNLLYLNRVEYLVSSDASGVVTNMKDVTEEVILNAAVIRPEIEIITDVEEVFFDGLMEAWRVSMENIMENAFRYAKSYIKIEIRENDLRISNDGPKMPEERIESLFRPYEKGEGGRFGLGLSIVSKVARANNYQVKGMNTEDGVCFRIFRPEEKHKNKNRRNSKK